MATAAQILANRSNAQKSTGPRTAAGKAIVAQNAVKHGLSGSETVIAGEDPGEFEFYRERMLAELDPSGEIEATLAERIVSLSWRLKRAERLQAAAFASLYARQKEWLGGKGDQEDEAVLGGALVRDYANARVLDRLLMYERRIEQSLYRTMAELKRHRILQEVGPGQMWELRRALASEDDAGKSAVRAPGEAALRTKATYEEPPAESAEAARGRDSSLQTSNITLPTSPGLSCKTKPISPQPDHSQVPGNIELTADSLESEPGQTKPIRREARNGDPLLQTPDFTLPTSQFPLPPLAPGRGAAIIAYPH